MLKGFSIQQFRLIWVLSMLGACQLALATQSASIEHPIQYSSGEIKPASTTTTSDLLIFGAQRMDISQELAPPKTTLALRERYTKDITIMHVYLEQKDRRVYFEVPRAYFYWQLDKIKDGAKLNNIKIIAAINEGMIPWSLAKKFTKKKITR